MSFEDDLFSLLSGNAGVAAIAGARIYPTIAPTSTAAPLIVWQRITSSAAVLAGRPVMEQIDLDVDCYAETFDAATALGRAVRDALEQANGIIRGALNTDSDVFEEGPRLFLRSLSFTVYHPAN